MGKNWSRAKSEEERLARRLESQYRYKEKHSERINESQARYKEKNIVKVRYKQLLKARQKRGVDISNAPTVEQVIAILGSKPKDTDEYTWSISFSSGNDQSCFDKTGELKLENAHWSKVLRHGVAQRIIDTTVCKDEDKRCARMVQRDFHKLSKSLDEITGKSGRILYKEGEFIGKTFGRLKVIDITGDKKKKKAVVKCMFCRHKFKRALVQLRKGRYSCTRCQSGVNISIAQARNSATATYYDWHYIDEKQAIYMLSQVNIISEYTYNASRPEQMEATVDVELLKLTEQLENGETNESSD